jgi:hypothetical protein
VNSGSTIIFLAIYEQNLISMRLQRIKHKD